MKKIRNVPEKRKLKVSIVQYLDMKIIGQLVAEFWLPNYSHNCLTFKLFVNIWESSLPNLDNHHNNHHYHYHHTDIIITIIITVITMTILTTTTIVISITKFVIYQHHCR